jgi:tetratricopeptide (TPR) repeat protein
VKGERSNPALPARRAWLPLALLLGLTAAAYLPTLANGFIWDDDVSLTQNPFIRSGDGLRQFWLTAQTPDYWPVTATTLWTEWRLWGLEPLGYHVTNLGLHLAEVALLWVILRRLRVPGATLGALLFALHPVNVESVAWITQRKNLMAMLFFLASILCFLKSGSASPDSPGRRLGAGNKKGSGPEFCNHTTGLQNSGPAPFYWISLLAFALALLSKGSVVILPVVLLGLIAWQRPVRRRDLFRLLPFFLAAAAITLVDIWFQGHHLAAAETIRRAGGLERLLGAGAVVWFYLSKAVWPLHLLLPYPLWRIEPGNFLWWLPLAGVIGVTGLLWWKAAARLRPPEAGYAVANSGGAGIWRGTLYAWGYFCLALLPVMGLTDVYFMKFSLVADHYQHLALIGVTTLAGAGWAEWRRHAPGALPLAAAVLAVSVLGGLTWRQCLRYRDAETFFEATVGGNPGSAMAQGNLGMLLGAQGRIPEATARLEEALRLDPDYAEAHINLGALLVGQGRWSEGEAQYRVASRLRPDLFVPHLNLGSIFLRQGRLEEARAELAETVRLKPSFPEGHAMLGAALLRLGDARDAIAEEEAALRLRPDYPEARGQLARALAATQRGPADPGGARRP